MSGPVIHTRVAIALHTEHFFRGHRLFGELAGRESVTGLVALAVSGRRLDPAACAMLDDLAVVTSVADPRIWPLKMSRVLASYGSVVLGCFGASLCLEELIIGPWSGGLAARWLSDLAGELGPRVGDDDAVRDAVRQRLARGERIPGFGVPLREFDERLVALRACVERRGRSNGRHWALMDSVIRTVRDGQGPEPNTNLGIAAVTLDLGFEPDEISPLMVFMSQILFIANALEGAQQRSAFLRDMPREHVRYVGAPPRESPRALASRERVPARR